MREASLSVAKSLWRFQESFLLTASLALSLSCWAPLPRFLFPSLSSFPNSQKLIHWCPLCQQTILTDKSTEFGVQHHWGFYLNYRACLCVWLLIDWKISFLNHWLKFQNKQIKMASWNPSLTWRGTKEPSCSSATDERAHLQNIWTHSKFQKNMSSGPKPWEMSSVEAAGELQGKYKILVHFHLIPRRSNLTLQETHVLMKFCVNIKGEEKHLKYNLCFIFSSVNPQSH